MMELQISEVSTYITLFHLFDKPGDSFFHPSDETKWRDEEAPAAVSAIITREIIRVRGEPCHTAVFTFTPDNKSNL